jgi:hypothetical protein
MLGVSTTSTTNQDAETLRGEVSWAVRLKQTRSGKDLTSDESKTRPKRPLMGEQYGHSFLEQETRGLSNF